MSIETLLEAAKFLELQAQHQQKAREENELREKLRLEQLANHRRADVTYTSPIRMNHVTRVEEPHKEHHPVPVPPLPPPLMPRNIIPAVNSNQTGLPTPPVKTLSPPAGPHLASPRRDPNSPQGQCAPLPLSPQLKTDCLPSALQSVNHKQHLHPQLVSPSGNPKLQQSPHLVAYPGSIVAAPQHALLPQPGPPAPQASMQTSPISRGSPPDDGRLLEKKRPGGAGTREVHNKLEKNRRAHLKECFETLKKNIPNVDEKKTSNLSVLRSALRYIQTLKRKEKEYEHEMERLAREKIATQQQLAELKNELSQWMDVMEIDRVLRQTVQPEDDQASTSTASEGEEEIMEDDLEDELMTEASTALSTVPQVMHSEMCKTVTPNPTTSSIINTHISIQHKATIPQPQLQPLTLPQSLSAHATLSVTTSGVPTTPIQALLPAQTHMVTTPSLQPTVIAHAAASHASVIQAVSHVIQASGHKHFAHLAPSSNSMPISHITVHPVTHLGQHMPTIYPQPVAVTQPAMVSHIAHTLTHAQVNGTAPIQPTAAILGKQTTVGTQVVTHHQQLVGQTVLNPVTMVTMPSFPVSTLKLA
ncbi:max-binding protein MNT isoform X1 [Hypomesus transpacificus]|uniref:max-binding protein MNT isoform X1 n=1 Tax=Hypomesus transpacificus TaxID=137520 RepID=UPI001F087F8A|nr:max-binding protein MNT isoform X1 [Hypomesus transpacificus]